MQHTQCSKTLLAPGESLNLVHFSYVIICTASFFTQLLLGSKETV